MRHLQLTWYLVKDEEIHSLYDWEQGKDVHSYQSYSTYYWKFKPVIKEEKLMKNM